MDVELRAAKFVVFMRLFGAAASRGSRRCRKVSNGAAKAIRSEAPRAAFERGMIPNVKNAEDTAMLLLRLRCVGCPKRCKAPVK